VQRILREQGLTFVQNVWRAGAEPPPPELEEDRVGDDGAEPHAATSADEEPAVPVTAAPRPGRPAHATQPAPPRLNANTEGRRKLQTVLDDLIACRQLIDDALADASLPHAD